MEELVLCESADGWSFQSAELELENAMVALAMLRRQVYQRENAYDNYFTGGYYDEDRLALADAERRVADARGALREAQR